MAYIYEFSKIKIIWFSFLFLKLATNYVYCDEYTHEYKNGDNASIWVERECSQNYLWSPCVGNETMVSYYEEKFSKPLQRSNLFFFGLQLSFNNSETKHCNVTFNDQTFSAVETAVKNETIFRLYIDELMIKDKVGLQNSSGYYVYTQKVLHIYNNNSHIGNITLHFRNESLRELKKLEPANATEIIPITYEVVWEYQNATGNRNFTVRNAKIEWTTIYTIPSVVVLIAVTVAIILMRLLAKDYARFTQGSGLDYTSTKINEDYGWKEIHGDVFRPPAHALFFSSLVGTGLQIMVVLIGVLLGLTLGDPSKVLQTLMFVYAVTSPVNGFFGGSVSAKSGVKRWISQMMVSGFLFPTIVCFIIYGLNWSATVAGERVAIKLATLAAVTLIFLFVILPLTLVGTVLGRNLSGVPDFPCQVNAIPRDIPPKRFWFLEPYIIIHVGGVLPFIAMFFEMNSIFNSFWPTQMAQFYGYMLLAFMVLSVSIIIISIIVTYVYLSSEDYRWQWTSFATSAYTGLFVYKYFLYHYFMRSELCDSYLTTAYFGYATLFTLAFALMCGSIGYMASSIFVRRIFTKIKIY